ncbi:hypothetical protein F5J12DRAFT_54912 [Pisolithus orientalis]|uniref:uncharacterized protein n=1 Tax=Pisolithus orientalis TaxID=936130 RepID=UPI002225804F|nr:uncharacterized protein F5J12DRAFT_54912 [Pisolithus orientalis]KAI6008826.1 hypothetical protein F5J12DRAFT_54912 [Pisolithus orientalis]
MSLDRNLFTLLLTPNAAASRVDQGVSVVDLIDPSGTVYYRKRRIGGGVYKAELCEPISNTLLATVTAPSATSKHKTMELYNPTKVVELKFTGTLSFKWSFKWEDHEFEWRREECFIVRKPDPPVLVALTKEPPGRIKTSSVQILDYNLHRFDIEDRKGLEIVILFALLTFQDSSDAYHEPDTAASTSPTPANSSSTKVIPTATAPPPLPPKPAPKTGVERIAELQRGRGLVNEVSVMEEGDVKDYAKYCLQLLSDDAMLFISVCSTEAAQVPKVLQVVEETKRKRYKAGDSELHQYVLYDTQRETPQKGPRIIKLDDEPSKSKAKDYTPPSSLIVHLSKIDMPELRPRSVGFPPSRAKEADSGRSKGKEKAKEKEKDRKKKKEKGKDSDNERVKKDKSSSPVPHRNSPPGGNSPARLVRPQSQHFQTYPSPHTRAYSHGNNSFGTPPPLPPRHARLPNPQSQPAHRQSMYGGWYGYPTNAPPPQPPATAPPALRPQQSSTGLLGRLLGAR